MRPTWSSQARQSGPMNFDISCFHLCICVCGGARGGGGGEGEACVRACLRLCVCSALKCHLRYGNIDQLFNTCITLISASHLKLDQCVSFVVANILRK